MEGRAWDVGTASVQCTLWRLILGMVQARKVLLGGARTGGGGDNGDGAGDCHQAGIVDAESARGSG